MKLYLLIISLILSFNTQCKIKDDSKQIKQQKLLAKQQPSDHELKKRSVKNQPFNFEAYKIATNYQNITKLSQIDGEWRSDGPNNIGGRINCIEIDPLNHNKILVGNAAGGIFLTENGGDTWIAVADNMTSLAVSDITIDPNNSNIIYAATGDHNITGLPHLGDGIYKSIDGGYNWTYLALTQTTIVSKIIVDKNNSNKIIAACMGNPIQKNADRGIYTSIDAGLTWSKTLYISDSCGAIDLIVDNLNSNILYCATWNRIRTTMQSIVNGPDAKIWKSIDGGGSWLELNNGLPQYGNIDRIALASSPIAGKLYAYFLDNYSNAESLYYSLDYGVTWQKNNNIGINSASSGFGWYFGQIRVNPWNDDEVSLASVELHTTFNRGQTFTRTSPEWYLHEVHADIHDIYYLSNDTILLATDGGLYKTTDHFTSWTKIDNIPNTQFYHFDINPLSTASYLGGAQDNGTVKGNYQNTNTWTMENGGDGFNSFFFPSDTNRFMCETQYGYMYYYDGVSVNWMMQPSQFDATNPGWDAPYYISKFDENVLVAASKYVYKTNNILGNNWLIKSPNLTTDSDTRHSIYHLEESNFSSDTVFASTEYGKLWINKSFNTSNSWSQLYTGISDINITSIKTSHINPSSVFVSYTGYLENDFTPYIYHSSDLGNTWNSINGNLPQIGINDILIMPTSDSMIFVATDIGVYFTNNMGNNWERVGNNMPNIIVNELKLDKVGNRIAAATFARGIYSFDMNLINTNLFVEKNILENSLKVYPSILKEDELLNIESQNKIGDIEIIDITGNQVLFIKVESDKASINVNSLKKGIYIVKTKEESIKIVII